MIDVFVDLFPNGLLQGLILAIMALGVFIPFRLLNFPDLTGEGSYPFGGICCTCFILSGFDPFVSTLIGSIAAGSIGIATALIYLRFKINTLLAGIILSTMFYSINLRLMGKPNISLFDQNIIFSFAYDDLFMKIILIILFLVLISIPLLLFLSTEKGLRFRAVGLNSIFAERQGVNLTTYTILGLFVGNALCGLAGSVMVQIQGYTDIGMGIGMVIHALAALMIGENILGNRTLSRQILAPILGALIYQQIQGFALTLGLAPSDLKFLTGSIILVVIIIRKHGSSFSRF